MGSEIYALELSRQQQNRNHVVVLWADYDPSRLHGSVERRAHDGVPVVKLTNNLVCKLFADTYRSPMFGTRIAQVLDTGQPDVVHVHNLLNLSFDLPGLARRRSIPVVATLHDYTLVCPSGGQRIHRAEHHACQIIDVDRCARCFSESLYFRQMAVGSLGATTLGSGWMPLLDRAARIYFPRRGDLRQPGCRTRLWCALGERDRGVAARIVDHNLHPATVNLLVDRRQDACETARAVVHRYDEAHATGWRHISARAARSRHRCRTWT